MVCVMILFLAQVDLLCADAVAADIREAEARTEIPVDDSCGLSLDLNEQFCRTSLRLVALEPRLYSIIPLLISPDDHLSGHFNQYELVESSLWRQPSQAAFCVFLI